MFSCILEYGSIHKSWNSLLHFFMSTIEPIFLNLEVFYLGESEMRNKMYQTHPQKPENLICLPGNQAFNTLAF